MIIKVVCTSHNFCDIWSTSWWYTAEIMTGAEYVDDLVLLEFFGWNHFLSMELLLFVVGNLSRLVFCFKWHVNLCGLFCAKAIIVEEQWRWYLTNSWEDNWFHTFPKGIWPKMRIIARLEYELAYYDVAVDTLTTTLCGLLLVVYELILCQPISLKDSNNKVKETSIAIRWTNYCFHVFVEHHYSGNNFFKKTID